MAILFQLLCLEETKHWIEVCPKGDMVLRDHPDPELDLIAIEMGFPSCGCFELLEQWNCDPLVVLFQDLTAGTDEDVRFLWAQIILEWIEGWNDVIEDELSHDPSVFDKYREAVALTKDICEDPERYFYEPGFNTRMKWTFRELRGQGLIVEYIIEALIRMFNICLIDDFDDALWSMRAAMEFLQKAAQELVNREYIRKINRGDLSLQGLLEEEKKKARDKEFHENLLLAIKRVGPVSVLQMRHIRAI